VELLIKEFLEILFFEKAIHEELLALAINKKDVLIANDVAALEEIVKKERLLLKKNRELESEREVKAASIAQALDIERDMVTLDTIEKHAQGIAKTQVSKLRGELISVVAQLADYNDINTDLIKTHLDYTYFSLDMMTQSGVTADTYDNSGYMKEDNKSRIGLIDQKA